MFVRARFIRVNAVLAVLAVRAARPEPPEHPGRVRRRRPDVAVARPDAERGHRHSSSSKRIREETVRLAERGEDDG